MKIENWPLEKIIPYENNPRKNSSAVDVVAKSLKQFGWQQPIVVGKDGIIIIGHTRLKAAKQLNYKVAPVYQALDLSTEETKALRLADNKSSEYAEWNYDLLSQELLELDKNDYDLLETGFSQSEIDGLLNSFNENTNDPDVIPEVEDNICKLGDLWELEQHRVLCGDSTKTSDVERLMGAEKIQMIFTDPPYGVSYGSKNEFLNNLDKGNCIQTDIKNDHLDLKDTGELWGKTFSVWNKYLGEYSCYYISSPQSGDLFLMMMMMMNENGFPLKHCLIWNKNNHILGCCDYMYKHEPILYGWKNKHKFYKNGKQNKSVLDFDKPLKNDLHPTMKPIALIENFILNSTEKEMLVCDMFLGSGSTLIACEKTNRRCFGMELEPKYISIILQRWADYTKKDPVRQDGKKWSELVND